jgi:hypothetical protein
LVAPAIKILRRRQRLHRIRSGDITPVWDEIVDRLIDLGEPVPESLTPLELAAHTDRMLVPLASRYSEEIYGERGGNAVEGDLHRVDQWVRWRYPRPRRLKAAVSPRSLLRRR